MYLIVRASDNIIVGTAIRPIDEASSSKNGYKIYQIEDSEFVPEMLGAKLEGFNKVRK